MGYRALIIKLLWTVHIEIKNQQQIGVDVVDILQVAKSLCSVSAHTVEINLEPRQVETD